MIPAFTRNTVVVLCSALALCVGLLGCSGSGDDDMVEMDMAQMMEDMEEQARLAAMAAAGLEGGLARSPQDAVFATSEENTIASLLPEGETVFSPSSAALYWDFLGLNKTVEQSELGAAYLKSISTDGAGGFHVIFVIEGTEYPAHFTRDKYVAGAEQHYREILEDKEPVFWSWTGSFTPEDDDHTDGASFRSYHDLHGWTVVGPGWERRGISAYGLETMPENMPTGSAAYEGYLIAEWWDADNPVWLGVDGRTFFQGTVNLEANMDDGTISGQVDEFIVPSWHSTSGEDEPLAGNSMDIASTAIEEARFASEWVGSGPMDVPAAETLHGFTGRIIGNFYGPAAEEAGGVLSGQRGPMGGSGDQFIIGAFSTAQPESGQ